MYASACNKQVAKTNIIKVDARCVLCECITESRARARARKRCIAVISRTASRDLIIAARGSVRDCGAHTVHARERENITVRCISRQLDADPFLQRYTTIEGVSLSFSLRSWYASRRASTVVVYRVREKPIYHCVTNSLLVCILIHVTVLYNKITYSSTHTANAMIKYHKWKKVYIFFSQKECNINVTRVNFNVEMLYSHTNARLYFQFCVSSITLLFYLVCARLKFI